MNLMFSQFALIIKYFGTEWEFALENLLQLFLFLDDLLLFRLSNSNPFLNPNILVLFKTIFDPYPTQVPIV